MTYPEDLGGEALEEADTERAFPPHPLAFGSGRDRIGSVMKEKRIMTRPIGRLLEEALELPDHDRAELAASLIESLDPDVDEDASSAWATRFGSGWANSSGATPGGSPGRRHVP